MLRTEKATYDLDLPHPWAPKPASLFCEDCGRHRDDPLHRRSALPERASDSSVLPRELGS